MTLLSVASWMANLSTISDDRRGHVQGAQMAKRIDCQMQLRAALALGTVVSGALDCGCNGYGVFIAANFHYRMCSDIIRPSGIR